MRCRAPDEKPLGVSGCIPEKRQQKIGVCEHPQSCSSFMLCCLVVFGEMLFPCRHGPEVRSGTGRRTSFISVLSSMTHVWNHVMRYGHLPGLSGIHRIQTGSIPSSYFRKMVMGVFPQEKGSIPFRKKGVFPQENGDGSIPSSYFGYEQHKGSNPETTI